jgi:hypothetical protein
MDGQRRWVMDTKESPLEYIIVYNGGAYGNFVGWCLEWLTGKVSLENRPWGLNGNSHKNKLIYYQSVESACSFKKTGIVHPIQDKETSLIDSLNKIQKNFDKVIFLYPQIENFTWNINNKFEKIFPAGWLSFNFDNIQKELKFWNTNISNLQIWEIREWLSYYIFSQHFNEVRFSEIDNIDLEILKINLSELRDDTKHVFKKMCDFLNLKIVRLDEEIDHLVDEWKNLQIHKDKDRLIDNLINAILQKEKIKFSEDLTIIDQAEIQRRLREHHNMHLKCYNLNTWPKDTIELNKLLFKEETHETTLQ